MASLEADLVLAMNDLDESASVDTDEQTRAELFATWEVALCRIADAPTVDWADYRLKARAIMEATARSDDADLLRFLACALASDLLSDFQVAAAGLATLGCAELPTSRTADTPSVDWASYRLKARAIMKFRVQSDDDADLLRFLACALASDLLSDFHMAPAGFATFGCTEMPASRIALPSNLP